MSAPTVSKPPTAYWLWLADNRSKIVAIVGTKVPDVGKKGGEMWKALDAASRAPYEKQAKAKKEEYEKFIATADGQKALQEKKDAKAEEKAEKEKKETIKAEKKAEKEQKKNDRECKAALKSIEKDDNLKKPQSAYWLWLNDNREKIAKDLGSSKASDVGKKAGEKWKTVSAAEKKPYEQKAAEQKAAYEKFIASEEGAAALKAFKEAKQNTKDQFKPKDVEVEAGDDKKRKADVKEAGEVAAKKARGKVATAGA